MKQKILNGTISKLYTDDKKPFRNPDDILKSAKKFYAKETSA